MRTITSPDSAWNQPDIPDWRLWDADALVAVARRGSVRVEPAPWLAPHQARLLHGLIDDLLTYHCIDRLVLRIPDGHLARQSQASDVAAGLAALAEAGVRVCWRPGMTGTGLHLLCRR